MNFCIINGKSSRLIKGLIVQELPPVRKPEMRIETVEIDGRDGDIVNKLGYASYEKTMKIGLYGDFDIDEVISFFDTEGEVIFSNEIEKYYRFAIYKEIDFERLIRFRTAEVVFHVQPFKFSTTETTADIRSALFKPKSGNYSIDDLSISVADSGLIHLQGSAQQFTEIYIPIEIMECAQGEYSLTVTAAGQNVNKTMIRITSDENLSGDVFGEQAIKLESGTISKDFTITTAGRYRFLWIGFWSAGNVYINLTVSVTASQGFIYNSGNTFSKPRYTISGSGQCSIKVNDGNPFYLNLSGGEIVLDCEEMNAYKGDTLLNRYVLGDYEDLYITQGRNVISWDGLVSSLEIENYSRWI